MSLKPRNKTYRTYAVFFSVMLLVALGIFSTLEYISKSSLFCIENISVYSDNESDVSNIKKSLQDYQGKSLLQLHYVSLEDTIRKTFHVSKARVFRKFPHTLEIYVASYKPIAMIKLDKLYAMDEDLHIFQASKKQVSQNYPIVYIDDIHGDSLGKIRDIIVSYKNFFMKKKLQYPNIKSIQIDFQSDATLFFSNGLTIYLGHGEFEKKWQRVYEIDKALEKKNKELTFAYFFDDSAVKKAAIRFRNKEKVHDAGQEYGAL